MDVIIVCHTEFGFVHDGRVIFDKSAKGGIEEATPKLMRLADKYKARVTFALCPEGVKYFPHETEHEIGLHVHPGWQEFHLDGFGFFVGDSFLREHCPQSVNSTALWDYPYDEQVGMINVGKKCVEDEFSLVPKVFVAGRWSENSITIRAIIKNGFTHDCTPSPRLKVAHSDWSKLPRICMPYQPKDDDYQEVGGLPLLLVPVSQMVVGGNVNPEAAPLWGCSWLKACFSEYYRHHVPLFQICLHSPCLLDGFIFSAMDQLLAFIARHSEVQFKFASEVYCGETARNYCITATSLFPYLSGLRWRSTGGLFRSAISKILS